jgi:hypothetical protein
MNLSSRPIPITPPPDCTDFLPSALATSTPPRAEKSQARSAELIGDGYIVFGITLLSYWVDSLADVPSAAKRALHSVFAADHARSNAS